MRLLAALTDMVAGLLGMVAVMIVTGGAAFAYMKLRGERRPSETKMPEFWQSAWWRGASQVATVALAPVGRNWRGPGYRVLGLRRVDAHSGGPVSIRSAVVGATFDSAWRAATLSLSRPRLNREQERMTALQAQMKEIERKYGADAEARQKALMQFYKTKGVSPLPACAWGTLPGLLVQLLVLACSRHGQTIRDRVTHTVVILDP
jgi:60Kd inner membrane protein